MHHIEPDRSLRRTYDTVCIAVSAQSAILLVVVKTHLNTVQTDSKLAVRVFRFASAFTRSPISPLNVVIYNIVAANKILACHPTVCFESEQRNFTISELTRGPAGGNTMWNPEIARN